MAHEAVAARASTITQLRTSLATDVSHILYPCSTDRVVIGKALHDERQMNGVLATRSAARIYFCGQAWRSAGAIMKGPTMKTFSKIAIASPAVIGAMALSLMGATPADAQSRYRDRDRDRDNDGVWDADLEVPGTVFHGKMGSTLQQPVR